MAASSSSLVSSAGTLPVTISVLGSSHDTRTSLVSTDCAGPVVAALMTVTAVVAGEIESVGASPSALGCTAMRTVFSPIESALGGAA